MDKIIINDDAFVLLLSSAIEVYKDETYGYLFGYRRKSDYHIELAVAHQSTERTRAGVYISEECEERLLQSINFLKGHKYVGEFHSHTNGSSVLSEYDKKDMLKSGSGVSLLVSVEKTVKYKKWKYDVKDRCLYGTIDDSYLVKMKAYKVKTNTKRIIKLRIRCDFIKKLNKKMRLAQLKKKRC